MRTLVHLSDLHFGRIEEGVLAPLIAQVKAVKPDVVIVSGDLTQRARKKQFKVAAEFLAALPKPQIVVPGNHDVPLRNVFARFFQPLRKFRKYITPDLFPTYADAEVAVVGISTARSLTVKGGRINARQVATIGRHLRSARAGAVKVVVSHHPFDLELSYSAHTLVGRAPMAMHAFAEIGVDLLLGGHVHVSQTGTTARRYTIGDYSAVAVQAGTATSTRQRHESNAFNVIKIARTSITVDRYGWVEERGAFVLKDTAAFRRKGRGWESVPPATRAAS